jgi:hypothetical protein
MNKLDSATNPKIDLADYFQRFSTRVLWHFTGYKKPLDKAFEILNAILETRTLRIGEKSEMILMHSGQQRWGYPVACMCDIPFRDLRIHMLRYGQFGIAFHKRAAIILGQFNPVFYVHRNNAQFKEAEELFKSIDPEIMSDSPFNNRLRTCLLMIGSYVKRGDLTRIIELDSKVDSSQENNFYYEREWRTTSSWKFDDSSIAAIMMPQASLSAFRARWGDRFATASIISSEMIETL